METQKPIYVIATWNVKDGQIAEVLSLIKILKEESSKEKGNLFYKIHQSNSDANTLVLFEGYADEAALTVHKNSAHYKELVLEKIIPLLENRVVLLTTAILEQ